MFIMSLLTVMSVPLLSQFAKTSKVQQTVKAVTAALYRARMEAMRTRKMVGVFFGDDVPSCKTAPLNGVLPSKGKIEIWTVLDAYYNGDFSDDGGCAGASLPYNNQGDWYPYRYPDRCLTTEPITFPDGIRILAGQFINSANAPQYTFGWPSNYMATPEGEIKRHTVTFARQGAMAQSVDGANSWWELLIFDEGSGEYAIISCGEWLCTSRPRVLRMNLNGIYGVSGTYYPISSVADVPKFVEQ
jgi:hypothetical protein